MARFSRVINFPTKICKLRSTITAHLIFKYKKRAIFRSTRSFRKKHRITIPIPSRAGKILHDRKSHDGSPDRKQSQDPVYSIRSVASASWAKRENREIST